MIAYYKKLWFECKKLYFKNLFILGIEWFLEDNSVQALSCQKLPIIRQISDMIPGAEKISGTASEASNRRA